MNLVKKMWGRILGVGLILVAVVICYDPTAPELFYVKGKEKRYFFACGLVALLGVGILFLESKKGS